MKIKLYAGLLASLSILGASGCADLNGSGYPYGGQNNGYGNSGYGNGGYNNGYGNSGYGNTGYGNGGYGYGNSGYDQREREREWRREQDLERERQRLEDERRRLQEQRERERDQYHHQPIPSSQIYNPRPAPQQESCPSGFQETSGKCSDKERKRGCRDIKMPSGKRCISK